MEKKLENLNKTTDVKKYLNNGFLTEPFLDIEYIKEKVLCDFNKKKDRIEEYTLFHSIFYWIEHCTKFGDEKFNSKNRFQRTAKEIWESKTCSCCSDYAILFATFSRQLGFPSTFLHTAELSWVLRLQNKENYSVHSGHSFCEVFYNDKWILVDPTYKQVVMNYDPNNLILPYKVGNGNHYIPYFRGLDLGKRQNTQKHNKAMDEACKDLKIK